MGEPHTTKQALEALGWRIERRPCYTTWIVRNPEGGVIGDDYPDVRYAVSMAHLIPMGGEPLRNTWQISEQEAF